MILNHLGLLNSYNYAPKMTFHPLPPLATKIVSRHFFAFWCKFLPARLTWDWLVLRTVPCEADGLTVSMTGPLDYESTFPRTAKIAKVRLMYVRYKVPCYLRFDLGLVLAEYPIAPRSRYLDRDIHRESSLRKFRDSMTLFTSWVSCCSSVLLVVSRSRRTWSFERFDRRRRWRFW